ncbi:HD domain-containing protein [Streptomyces buecherae]|uniref:HD domain-containing protein n=1 Tax=Streptomyces buecherae TaxID=2763006 RepID=UPI001E636146|nr:HD domain-containing protein [Streptomyces buecherae]
MLNEVAGLRVPTGRAAEAARLVCTEYADDALYHHSVRSYFFGAAWARARGLDFDSELLYVSALLHDMGLTAPFDSHRIAFEEAGGHLARVFTAGLGWPTERRDRAAEIIVLHMHDEVAPEVDVESRLLQEGTSADVTGTGLEEYDPEFARALVTAYPRLGFGASFVGLFRDQAERKPDCAAAGFFTRGAAERTLAHPLEQS